MAYLLVIAAVLIVIRGLVRLRGPHRPHPLPVASFLIWAVLVGSGIAIWMVTTQGQ